MFNTLIKLLSDFDNELQAERDDIIRHFLITVEREHAYELSRLLEKLQNTKVFE